MAWPPTIPPATRANSTTQLDTHPSDHNAISAALTELVARLTPLVTVEGTANVTITATTPAAAQTVISSGALTLDGTPILLEYSCPFVSTPLVNNAQLYLALWDGSTDLGYFGGVQTGGTVATSASVYTRRRFTPAAGAHTFTIRAFVSPSGSGVLTAGPGSVSGQWQPMLLTVRRA